MLPAGWQHAEFTWTLLPACWQHMGVYLNKASRMLTTHGSLPEKCFQHVDDTWSIPEQCFQHVDDAGNLPERFWHVDNTRSLPEQSFQHVDNTGSFREKCFEHVDNTWNLPEQCFQHADNTGQWQKTVGCFHVVTCCSTFLPSPCLLLQDVAQRFVLAEQLHNTLTAHHTGTGENKSYSRTDLSGDAKHITQSECWSFCAPNSFHCLCPITPFVSTEFPLHKWTESPVLTAQSLWMHSQKQKPCINKAASLHERH